MKFMNYINYIPESNRKAYIFDNKTSILVDREITKFKDEAKSCKIKVGTIFYYDTLELALFGAKQHEESKQKLLSKQLTI